MTYKRHKRKPLRGEGAKGGIRDINHLRTEQDLHIRRKMNAGISLITNKSINHGFCSNEDSLSTDS